MLTKLMADIDPRDRIRLWIVFLVGCVLIAKEIVAFQTLVYVNEYLPATQVIAIALLGIALGGLLSYFVSKFDRDKAIGVLLALFPIAIVISFPVIIRLNPQPLLMMALMTLPYVVASLIISLMFNTLKPSVVYMFDLCGAGVGAILVVAVIPFLREEGSFFLLGVLGSVPMLLFKVVLGKGKGKLALVVGILLLAGNLSLLTTQLVADTFNIAMIGTADVEEYPQKIFFITNPKEGEEKPRHILKYSRGSLMERIDIGYSRRGAEKNPKGHDFITWYNGRPNDHISRYRPKKAGWLDRRLPTRLKLGQDPDTLLVGPAAEGLTKPVIALGDGHVDAVEINTAVAGLMMNELYRVSGRAYKGFNLVLGDVRTFLARTDREYDFITLLNTHRIRTMGHQGPPEYCHTLEAMTDYITHLKPEGYLVFEERNVNDRADLGIRRMLRTIKTALEDLGAKNPEEHILVYEFFVCRKKVWFKNRDKCRRGTRYTMIMVKRSPVNQEEHDHLDQWTEDLGKRRNSRGFFRGIEWMYRPHEPKDNYFTETILAKNSYDPEDIDPAVHNMSTITDDKPYPYDVFLEHEKPRELLKNITILALVMVLFPTIIAFVARRKKGEKAQGKAVTNLLLVLYFAALGIGYLLIEIVMMQKLQMFLTSPVYSMVIVLGAMLIASGIGGYRSMGITKKKALISIGLVVVISIVYYLTLGTLLEGMMFLPFALRVPIAVVLIGVLAFFMGMPFPYAMAVAKDQLTDRHAGLLFGINGAIGAIATPLSIILAMTVGFSFTILIGGAAYLVCLLLLAPVRTSE